MPKIANKTAFLTAIKNIASGSNVVSRAQCVEAANSVGLKYPPAWFVQNKSRSAGRGYFFVDVAAGQAFIRQSSTSAPTTATPVTPMSANTHSHSVSYALASSTNGERTSLVPDVNPEYVAWGHYDDILQIVKSNIFAPIFITGLSGNGKTTMVEQICAKMKRECFRVNITADTDEDELLGSWRLINGNMEWQDGPVILAMKRGAILLLDEVDLGTEKCMCLQAPLEGKGVYLKKIGQFVIPANGFNIIATANTKGKGSDDGRFVGTRVMNEAALDRYDYTFEQEYAPRGTEKKILLKAMKKFGAVDENFADCLVKWTEIIRKSFTEGAVDEIISTRRAINICKAYAMFGNKSKAITLALTRFDKDTQSAFMSLYNKIDGEQNVNPVVAEVAPPHMEGEPPF
jgi:cobaltochelatase CobS